MEAIELNESLGLVDEGLAQAPRVLILGQHYLGRKALENPVLAAVRARLGVEDLYGWWLSEGKDPNSRAKTLSALEDAVIVRTEIMRVLGLQWTAAFTSAIDATTRRLLAIPGSREVHQIFRPAGASSHAGSIALFRLFGSVDRSDPEELPPNADNELRRRRRLASGMLDYLPEIVAAGNVFIDGWWAGVDWLRTRELSQALAAFSKGQVFLFGADDQVREGLEGDQDFVDLIDSGVVTLIRQNLVDIVEGLKAAGHLRVPDDRYDAEKTQIFYPVVHKRPSRPVAPSTEDITTAIFPRLEWRRLCNGEQILADLDPRKPLPASPTGLAEAFRSFAGGGFLWEWLEEFAFQRTILNELVDECCKALETANPEQHTIVVYGQSGSGKSVLLRLLALRLRRMGLGVIFSGPSILPVNREHVEAFCETISLVSTAPVFLINDGTRDETEYLELAAYLASRARSCVVVGSSYPAQKVGTHKRYRSSGLVLHRIVLPVKLADNEAKALLKHIAPFIVEGEHAHDALWRYLGQDVSNFFAVIYRLLPESRPSGRRGIVSEITESSRKLQERLQRIVRNRESQTSMGLAVQKAFAEYLEEHVQDTVQREVAEEGTTDVNDALRLINAVMVVSKLGLQVPQSLALRLIGYNIPAYKISVDGDVLHVWEVQEGVYTLQARHALEASIWVEERIHSIEEQFALIQQLVKQIRGSEVRNDRAIELEFVAQVLRSLGPQGQERFKRPVLYFAIAALVAELRTLHSDVHPRLLLIESNAIREGIKREKLPPHLALDQRREHLNGWVKRLASAEDGLRIAQEIVQKPMAGTLTQGARRMLATLATERAAVMGFMIGSLIRALPPQIRQKPEWTKHADQWLSDAAVCWREALSYDNDNVQAIDTASWILAERYDVGGLSPEQEVELLADWSEIIERYTERDDLTGWQLDMRDQREARFSLCLGDSKRFASVTQRAEERGSNAVHALNARLLEKEEGAAAARRYLEEKCGVAKFLAGARVEQASDRPIILLYNRLWWKTETGFDRYLPEERIRLKFSRDRWGELLNLCQARLSIEGEGEHSVALFLSACAMFHLGRVEEAERVIDFLDRLGVGGVRRSRALLLLTDENGTPRQLTAEFQGRRRGEHLALAWSDDLRTNVLFNPVELLGPGEINSGQRIGPFHLSFRFRGIYAEPLRRLAWHLKNG